MTLSFYSWAGEKRKTNHASFATHGFVQKSQGAVFPEDLERGPRIYVEAGGQENG
jgi:hypothetical protein